MDFSDVHLVHVVRQYAPNVGGLENFVANLTAQQKGRFASLKVVTLDRLFKDPDRMLPQREIIDGVEVHRIPFRGSSRYPIAFSVFKELAGADLVHVHAVDFFFDALALGRALHKVPLVATTHGGFFHTKKFARLKSFWFNTLTRLSAQQYRKIACCSESDLAQFARIAPARVSLIENGVDLDKFWSAASSDPRRSLVTIGRFSDNKRLDRVLDALAILNQGVDEWRLDIIGSEADLTETDLVGMAAQKGVSDQVGIRIGLSDSQVREVLQSASLFVSASDYEGFGIAAIEAMSAGLIPVVHPNEAFRVFADRHAEVHLADFDHPEVVAATIRSQFERLGDGNGVRGALLQAARGYGWQATAGRYDALYRACLSV